MSTVAGTGHQVSAPSNLPQHLTTFVGREAELRSLKSLLTTSRIVTLTGTGGAGKSRLAAELARANRQAWPDGTWWIELAAAKEVADAVVATLELPGRGPAVPVITSWLAAKRVLLIIDNCEHLAAAVAAMTETLLGGCPQLTVLATSREILGVSGEVRWQVAPMDNEDAIRLFEARARLVAPAFKVTTQNAMTVSEICERLDRLPLAIEMAAARLDFMSERELLATLSGRLSVLASGTRTAPERQQTMIATIDWSHRLLTEPEARLFHRLAAFHGGFTLEAAQDVCSDAGEVEVVSLLTGLVKKSMVVADRVDEGTRYRLLESHRDYALQKLHTSGELQSTSRRHYDYYRAWLRPETTAKAKARESGNLWAALDWASGNVDDMGLDLAIEVADSEYSNHARARRLLVDLLERSPAEGATRARALNLAARLTSRQGDHSDSKSLADSSVAAARQLKDPNLLARMLSGAGVVYHAADDLASARRMYDEALKLLKGAGNQNLAIEAQNQLAVLATEEGRFAEAKVMLAECVAFSRSRRPEAITARYLESLANVELSLGDVDAADRDWREALLTFRELSDPFGTIWCVGGLALVASKRADHDKALRLAAVVDRMSREWSLSAWSVRVHQLKKAADDARERLGTAKAAAVWTEGQSLSSAAALEYTLGDFGPPADSGPAGLLSRREREVAAMVASGMTNKEIAARLFIAERTAEGHVERIRNKLGVRSRTEVATWAIAHGLSPANLDKPSTKSTV